MIRTLAAITVSAALTITLAACSDANGDPQPLPPATDSPSVTEPTASETTEPTQEPTDTAPTTGPLAGYTAEEIHAYEDAADVWKTLQEISSRLWAAGKATPAAKREYDGVYAKGADQPGWVTLQYLDRTASYTRGKPKTIWMRPKRVLTDDRGGTVTFRTCTNSNAIRVFRRGGRPVKQDANRVTIFEVVVDQERVRGAMVWQISGSRDVGRC